MAAKKGGLGKGLDSLITDKVNKPGAAKDTSLTPTEDQAVMVPINKVEPNKEQPRKHFNEDALLELSESIKQMGIIQPIVVQDRNSYYEIIAGERRWRAAKQAGLKKIPVIIKNYTEQEIVEISLIENIQREDLNPIEEAFAYKRLLEEFNLKQDEVAERVSKSRTAVTNSIRLLKLNEKVQQMVIDDMIQTGHARALLGIEDLEKQYMMAQKVFDEKLSVRETEKLVKKVQKEKEEVEKTKMDKQLEIVYQDLEEKMKQILGTKVSINAKDENKGKIEIEYYNKEDNYFEVLNGLKYNQLTSAEENERIIFMRPCIWSALYKKKLLTDNNIVFNETPGASYQDTAFAFKVWVCAKKVYFLKDAFLHYRMDNENSSVKSSGKVFSICDEFQSMQAFLNQDVNKKNKYSKILQVLKLDTYTWNLNRIAPEYQKIFKIQIGLDFIKAKYDNVLEEKYFDSNRWKMVLEYIQETKNGMVSSNREEELKEEVSDLKNSMSYKIGHMLVFIPGKILRFIKRNK